MCIHLYTYVCMYVHMCMCIYNVYMCMCIYRYTFLCVFMYTKQESTQASDQIQQAVLTHKLCVSLRGALGRFAEVWGALGHLWK